MEQLTLIAARACTLLIRDTRTEFAKEEEPSSAVIELAKEQRDTEQRRRRRPKYGGMWPYSKKKWGAP